MKHVFNADDTEMLAGEWISPDGTRYCRWSWNTQLQVMTVSVAGASQRRLFDLTPELLDHEHLRETLPDLALQTAETLRAAQWTPRNKT